MRVNEILREYDDDEPSTKWESWPGNAKELPGSYVTEALANPEHPSHQVFKIVRDNIKTRMFRGMRFPEGDPNAIYYMDPTTAPERTSKGTHNFYTWFMDHISPEWKQFPKRGKSFICATNPSITGMYGKAYVMVPARRTLVGVCPSDDIWYSFKHITPTEVIDLISRAIYKYKVPYPVTAAEFVKTANTLAELIAADPERNMKLGLPPMFSSQLGQSQFNFITLMSHFMKPEENGFKLVDWPTMLQPSVEVWFSEPCYAIPMKIFPTLMALKK